MRKAKRDVIWTQDAEPSVDQLLPGVAGGPDSGFVDLSLHACHVVVRMEVTYDLADSFALSMGESLQHTSTRVRKHSRQYEEVYDLLMELAGFFFRDLS